jgi:hypothetical protein
MQQPTKYMRAQGRRRRGKGATRGGMQEGALSHCFVGNKKEIDQKKNYTLSLLKKKISANSHNYIISFRPTLGYPLSKMLPKGHWLVCHSHATVASYGTTMVMGFKDV